MCVCVFGIAGCVGDSDLPSRQEPDGVRRHPRSLREDAWGASPHQQQRPEHRLPHEARPCGEVPGPGKCMWDSASQGPNPPRPEDHRRAPWVGDRRAWSNSQAAQGLYELGGGPGVHPRAGNRQAQGGAGSVRLGHSVSRHEDGHQHWWRIHHHRPLRWVILSFLHNTFLKPFRASVMRSSHFLIPVGNGYVMVFLV